jgi:hypothetical protein
VEQLLAAKVWVLSWGLIITFIACATMRFFAPPQLLGWRATASQLLTGAAMCVLLTDIFFLNVTIVPFTGEPPREQSSLAASLLKYLAFAPGVALFPLFAEPWIEMSTEHCVLAVTAIAAGHFALRSRHRTIIREHCNMAALEDDEQDFPMKLGLRY